MSGLPRRMTGAAWRRVLAAVQVRCATGGAALTPEARTVLQSLALSAAAGEPFAGRMADWAETLGVGDERSLRRYLAELMGQGLVFRAERMRGVTAYELDLERTWAWASGELELEALDYDSDRTKTPPSDDSVRTEMHLPVEFVRSPEPEAVAEPHARSNSSSSSSPTPPSSPPSAPPSPVRGGSIAEQAAELARHLRRTWLIAVSPGSRFQLEERLRRGSPWADFEVGALHSEGAANRFRYLLTVVDQRWAEREAEAAVEGVTSIEAYRQGGGVA